MTQIHEDAYDLPAGWRPGQFLFNFLHWLKAVKGYSSEHGCKECRMADPFHLDVDKWNALVKEYLAYLKQ